MSLPKEVAKFKKEWADRETRDAAKQTATAYVNANRARFEEMFGGFGIKEMVMVVDLARARGDELGVIEADMWLQAEFEPQRIVGNAIPGRGRR